MRASTPMSSRSIHLTAGQGIGAAAHAGRRTCAAAECQCHAIASTQFSCITIIFFNAAEGRKEKEVFDIY
jgi:hypothetical protein